MRFCAVKRGVGILENFAKRLEECRKNAKLSQRKTAELLGIGFSTYRRYEKGERVPALDDAAKMAKLFRVSLDYLAGLTDEPTA